MGSIGFGRLSVNGDSRVPKPPASITESIVVFSELFLDPNKYALPDEGTAGLNRVPRSLNPNDRWYPGHGRNDDVSGEAGGYRMQTTF